MNKFLKLVDHFKKGSILSRIRYHSQIETERKWREFYANKREDVIIKNFSSGGKIKLKKYNLLSKSIYNNNFEVHELNYLKRNLKRGDIFIDIGANIGLFSIAAAYKVGESGKVFSFEPTYQTFNQLIENIDLNNLKNVFAFNYAVSDKDGELNIAINDDDDSALNSVSTIPDQNSIEKVKCITIDSFIVENNLKEKISLVKIDVEGWEIPVLLGMKNCIENFCPTLIIEINEQNYTRYGYTIDSFLEILSRGKYNLYEFDSAGELIPFQKRNSYSYMNIVARHDKS